MSPERDPQAEIEKLEQRFAENPEGRMFAHLADAYRKAGELDQAERIVLDGLERHPDYVSAHLVLGRVYMDGGRVGEAGRQFQRTLELDPHNLIALKALGDLAVQKGASQEARSWYERMLQVDPYNDEAQAALEGLGARPGAAEPPVAMEPGEGAGGPTAPAAGDVSELEITEPLPEVQEADLDTESEIEVARSESQGEPQLSERPEGFFPEEPATEPTDADRAGTPELESTAESVPGESEGADEPDAGELDIDFEEMDSWSPGLVQEEDFEGEQMDDEELLGPSESEGEEDDVVTETMAELYMGQGLHREALEVYRQLGEVRPHDERIRARIRELEEQLGMQTAGEPDVAAVGEEDWEAAVQAEPEPESLGIDAEPEEPVAEAELEELGAEAGFEGPEVEAELEGSAAEDEHEERVAEVEPEQADAFSVEPGDVEELFATPEGSVEEAAEPAAHPELETTRSETDIDAEDYSMGTDSAEGEFELEVRAPDGDELEKLDPFAASFEYPQETGAPSLFEEEVATPSAGAAETAETIETGFGEPDIGQERMPSDEEARPEPEEIAASSYEAADVSAPEPERTEDELAPTAERQEQTIRAYLLELLHPTAAANGSAEDVAGASSGSLEDSESGAPDEYDAETGSSAEQPDEPEDLAQFQEWLRSLKR